MTPVDSERWRPQLPGWSIDILPFYLQMATELPAGAQVVEVGVYFGRSLLFLAEQMLRLGKRTSKLWAVDPWTADWSLRAPDMSFRREDAQRYEIAQAKLIQGLVSVVRHATEDELQIIHPVRAPSVRAARLFAAGELDLVFVDGAHDEHSVANDIAAWWPKVKAGGTLAGHDYDTKIWPGVCTAVDAFVGDPVARRDIAAQSIPHAPLKVSGTSVWSVTKGR